MNYEMGGTILCKTMKKKYLGVTIKASMKVSENAIISVMFSAPPVFEMIMYPRQCREVQIVLQSRISGLNSMTPVPTATQEQFQIKVHILTICSLHIRYMCIIFNDPR